MSCTKGPWESRGARVLAGRFVVCEVNAGEYVAPLHAMVERREANARLIAAAPELAEALKEARPCVEEIADQVDCTAPHKAVSIYALLARIDALLAKANGGGNG